MEHNVDEIFQLLKLHTNICRLCFKKLDKGHFIFEKEMYEFCFKKILLKHEKYRLPSMVCPECHTSMHETYNFLKKVSLTQDILERFVNIESTTSLVHDDNIQVKEEEIYDVHKDEYCDSDIEVTIDDRSNHCNNEEETCASSFAGSSLLKLMLEKPKGNTDSQKLHLKSHTVEEPYTCNKCGKSFVTNHTLQQHLIDHHGVIEETKNLSDVSQDEASAKEVANIEENNILELSLHSSDCTEDIQNYEIFTNKELHDNEDSMQMASSSSTSFHCTTCDKKFSSNDGLQIHIKTHAERKRHTCNECGLSFIDNRSLVRHQRVCTYRCSICNTRFKDSHALRRHKAEHTGDIHMCDMCGTSFNTLAKLTYHKAIHSGEFTCNICNKAFPSSSRLKNHIEVHADEKKYSCDICPLKFRTAAYLQCHKKSHTAEKRFACTYANCDKKYKTKGQLTSHIRSHTGERPFSCTICHQTFPESGKLRKHERIKHDLIRNSGLIEETTGDISMGGDESCTSSKEVPTVEENIVLPVSLDKSDLAIGGNVETNKEVQLELSKGQIVEISGGDEFFSSFKEVTSEAGNNTPLDIQSNPETNQEVENIITNEDSIAMTASSSFQCTICDQNFSSNDELQIHVKTHAERKRHTCNECGLSFIDNRSLTRHQKTCTYRCSICKVQFKNSHSLKRHEAEHKGEIHMCDICGSTFNTPAKLTHHRAIHSGEFTCNICNKAFSNKSRLKNHIEVHADEKKYSCDICDGKFRTVVNLLSHKRTHTAEKRFVCTYANCDKRYKTKGQLTTHIRSHTGEKPFKCTICDETFSESSKVRRHERSKHDLIRNSGLIEETTGDISMGGDESCASTVEENIKLPVSLEKSDLENVETNKEVQLELSRGQIDEVSGGDDSCDSFKEVASAEGNSTLLDTQTNPEKNKEVENIINNFDSVESTASSSLQCTTCNKNFSSNQDLQIHVKTHTERKRHTCTDCGLSFIDNGSLTRHQRKCSYKCSICNARLKNLHALKKHEAEHTGDIHMCDICGSIFNTSTKLTHHRAIHSGEFTCNICNKALPNKSRLKNHIEVHAEEKKYTCDICNGKFRTAVNLQCHKRTHTTEKRFACTYANCDKRYKTKGQLTSHIRSHTGEKPFRCKICYKNFAESSKLRQHERIKHDLIRNYGLIEESSDVSQEKTWDSPHAEATKGPQLSPDKSEDSQSSESNQAMGNEENPEIMQPSTSGINSFQCNICDQKCTSDNDLQIHVKLHTERKRYTCDQCGQSFIDIRSLTKHQKLHIEHQCSVCQKKFPTAQSLKSHLLLHSDEKNYICDICGEGLKTADKLTKHKALHTGEFTCNICDKRFMSKPCLTAHLEIHVEQKNHSCEICDKKFQTAYNLKRHMITHEDERPFVCSHTDCNKSYKLISQLHIHLRTHTGAKPYQCKICDKVFNEPRNLKRHTLRVHEN